jgi:Uncharacterized conserved protein
MKKYQINFSATQEFLDLYLTPLSVFFIYDENSKLISILYEVKNTFGEQHTLYI